MFGRKFRSEIRATLARIERGQSLHAQAHSGEMNHKAGELEAIRKVVKDGVAEVHKRISFLVRKP